MEKAGRGQQVSTVRDGVGRLSTLDFPDCRAVKCADQHCTQEDTVGVSYCESM